MLLWYGVWIGPVFIVVFLIEGTLRKGYYPMRQAVSALAIGPRGWIQQANFLITAILTLAYSLGLHFAMHGLLGSIMLPVLVSITGVGLIRAGLFVTDVTGLSEDRHKPTQRTKNGRLHDQFSLLVFASLFITPFVYAYLSIQARHWDFALYSILSALVLALSLVLAVAGFRGVPKLTSFGGLFQRISICAEFIWLSIIAVHLTSNFM